MASTRPYKKQHTSFAVTDKESGVSGWAYIDDWTTYCYTSYNHVEHTEITVFLNDGRRIEVMGRSSWSNRPWQRFDYDNSRQYACEKLPAGLREQIHHEIVDEEDRRVREKCDQMFGAFSKAWSMLSDENKQKIAEKVDIIETPEQANAVTGLVTLTALMQ